MHDFEKILIWLISFLFFSFFFFFETNDDDDDLKIKNKNNKKNEAWPNALVWQSMWIFEKFYCTITFIGVKTEPKWTKKVPLMWNKSNCPWWDYVPISTLRVPPALVECQLACPILTRPFVFLGFFWKFFYPFWNMKHFPSQIQTL